MKQYVMIIILIVLCIGINSYTREGFSNNNNNNNQVVGEINDYLDNSTPMKKLDVIEGTLKKYLQLLTNANQNYLTMESKNSEVPDFKLDISSCNLGEQVIHIDVPTGKQGIQGNQGSIGNRGPQGNTGEKGLTGYQGELYCL